MTSVKFFLRHGAIIDWPVPDPENFSFQVLCLNIRSNGYFSTPEIYIPHDEIAAIGISSGAFTVKQPSAPEHRTKQ